MYFLPCNYCLQSIKKKVQITIYKICTVNSRTNYSKRSFSYSAAQVRLRLVYTSDGIGIGIGMGIKSGRNLTVMCKSRNIVISGSRRVTESESEGLEGFLFIRIPFRFSRLRSRVNWLNGIGTTNGRISQS